MPTRQGDAASIRPRSLLIVASLAVLAGGGALYWYLAPGPESVRAARPSSRPPVRISVAGGGGGGGGIPRSKASCRRCCSPKASM